MSVDLPIGFLQHTYQWRTYVFVTSIQCLHIFSCIILFLLNFDPYGDCLKQRSLVFTILLFKIILCMISLQKCLLHCDTLNLCVGFAQNKIHCYICDNSSAEGDFVPVHMQNRFLIWRDHLSQLPGMICNTYYYFVIVRI